MSRALNLRLSDRLVNNYRRQDSDLWTSTAVNTFPTSLGRTRIDSFCMLLTVKLE